MEKTPLLRSVSTTKEPEKTKFGPLVLVGIILCLWMVGEEFHVPVLTQYLYMRVKEEVYPNGTLPEVKNVTCYENSSTSGFHLQEKAQQITNTMQMQFSLSKIPLEFTVTLVLGSYSDFVGRKMLFLIPCIGYLVKNSVFTAIIYWHLDLNLYYIGEILEGLTGTSTLFKLACYACVSDNTPARGSRTLGLVVIDVINSVSQAAVSMVTGIFIENYGFFYPSLISAILNFVVIIVVVVILPEHVKKKGSSCSNLATSLKNVFSSYVVEGSKRRKLIFWLAMLTYIVSKLSIYIGNIETLWKLNYPLCWGPEMIGYYGMATILVKQIFTLPLLRGCQLCISDELIFVFSSIVNVASNVLHAFATTDWLMYGVGIIGVFSLGTVTIIRAVLSRLTSPDRQGAVMAGLSAIEVVCKAAGEPLFSFVYRSTVMTMKGAAYFMVAGYNFLAVVLFVIFTVLVQDIYKSELSFEEHVTIQNSEDDEEEIKPRIN